MGDRAQPHLAPAILLREGYREGGKVRSRTLANLSHWPAEKIEALRRVLRGEAVVGADNAREILRTRPHGHVAAVLGTLRRLGLDTLLASKRSPERDRVVAMICARLLAPCSKLATVRELNSETLTSTLGECLHLGEISEDALYEAMDWLGARQARIEERLAKLGARPGGEGVEGHRFQIVVEIDKHYQFQIETHRR